VPLKDIYVCFFDFKFGKAFVSWNSFLAMYKPQKSAENLALEDRSFDPLILIHLLRHSAFDSLFLRIVKASRVRIYDCTIGKHDCHTKSEFITLQFLRMEASSHYDRIQIDIGGPREKSMGSTAACTSSKLCSTRSCPSHRKELPHPCSLYFNFRSAELRNALATEGCYYI